MSDMPYTVIQLPEGMTITQESLKQIITDAIEIANLSGAPYVPGKRYEDAHLRIEWPGRELVISLCRPDETGNPVTEVFQALYDAPHDRWFIYVFRPGEWPGYLKQLAARQRAKDDQDLDRIERQMDFRFAPVADQDLAAMSAEPTVQEISDVQSVRVDLWDLRNWLEARFESWQR